MLAIVRQIRPGVCRGPPSGWQPRYSFEDGLAGVWEEWSQIELDAVAAGVGAVGAAR